jgi:tetratricopeptide (TPR) repeat protein
VLRSRGLPGDRIPDGDNEASLRTLERGLGLGETSSRPTLLNNLGMVLTRFGRYDEAITAAAEALDIQRDDGLRRKEAYVLDTLGMAYAGKGSTDKAIEALEAAVRVHRELGNRPSEAVVLRNLGMV